MLHAITPPVHWSDDIDPADEAIREAEFVAWLREKEAVVAAPSGPVFTHVGYRPHTGHTRRGNYLSGHTDPKPGKVHALNRKPGNGYLALCGERVPLIAEDVYGNEVTDHVEAAAPSAVTCKRCKMVLGL